MCDFGTMLIAGTVMSAVGSIVQGQQAAAMGKAQKAAYDQQAEADRIASGYEATREFEKGQRATAVGVVQTAREGVTLAGSPTDVLAENAVQNQLDIDAIRFGSKIRQNNLRTQGEIALMKGQQAQAAGFINAGSTIFGGFSQLYNPTRSVRLGGSMFA